MEINLENYKNFLCDTLLKNKEEITKSRLVLAQKLSSSVPDYLEHSPDINNEKEKEIYQYARQLMNDVLQGKTDYNQLITQMKTEGVTLGYTESEKPECINILHPSPLMETILAGDFRQFKRLIKDGADVNEQKKAECSSLETGSFTYLDVYPLSVALFAPKNPYIWVNSLIEAGAIIPDTGINVSQALFYAKDNLTIQVIEELKKGGQVYLNLRLTDVYNDGDTPLLAMMRDGHYKSAKALIQAGSDVNIANRYEKTSLDLAIEAQNYPMTKLLIESGANVDKQTYKMIDEKFKDKPFARKKLRLLIKKVKKQKELQQKQKNASKKTDDKLVNLLKTVFSGGRN